MCWGLFLEETTTSAGPNSKYMYMTNGLLRNFQNIRICTRKKPIVSVAGLVFERKPVPTKNVSAWGSHRNFFKEETHDLSEVSRFLFKSFHICGLQKHCFVPHTNSDIVKVTQQCRWSYFELGPSVRQPAVVRFSYAATTCRNTGKTVGFYVLTYRRSLNYNLQ